MARALVTLQEQLRKLNPACDDCPSPCRLRYEAREIPVDLPDFCDECEVRKQIGFFEEAFLAEVSLRFPEGLEWSLDTLARDVKRVRRIDARLRGKGYPRGCDEQTAALLDIVRSEDMRPVRLLRWETDQRLAREK